MDIIGNGIQKIIEIKPVIEDGTLSDAICMLGMSGEDIVLALVTEIERLEKEIELRNKSLMEGYIGKEKEIIDKKIDKLQRVRDCAEEALKVCKNPVLFTVEDRVAIAHKLQQALKDMK